jgi:hypothetical protein
MRHVRQSRRGAGVATARVPAPREGTARAARGTERDRRFRRGAGVATARVPAP